MLRRMILAAVIFVTSATLLPVRAQNSGGQVLPNIMFGSDAADPTAKWTTTIIATNVTQTTQGVDISIKDLSGRFVSATAVVEGNVLGDVGMLQSRGLPPLAKITYVLSSVSAIAVPLQLIAQDILGDGQSIFPTVVISALVQKTAANGKILSLVEVVDPKTIPTAMGSNFVVPVMLGTNGSDTTLLFSNSGTVTVPVTISVCNGISYDPMQTVVATATINLAPGMVAQTVSQLFAGNADLQNFFLQGPPPGWSSPFDASVITVTAGAPFALAVSRINSSPDGSVVQTPANSFNLAQPPIAQQ